MTLISVLIGLLLDRIAEFHRESRGAGWFAVVSEAIAVRLPTNRDGAGAALVIVLPPMLVMLGLQWLVGPWLFGLVWMLLGILVLLFCLGPLDVVDILEDYVEARRADDRERSDWYYQRFTGEPVPDCAEEEGRGIVEAVLSRVHDHVFATVFWFCVLGPAGAVLYRVAAEAVLHPSPTLTARPQLQHTLRLLLGVLGWIPARLIAFGYALTGSFEHALGRLRSGADGADDLLTANHWLLVNTGTAALRGDDEIERDEPSESGERRSHHPAAAAEGARRLAQRTAILWLAALALLTLVGWFA